MSSSPASPESEYEYLLHLPEQEGPNPENTSDLKCDVAGVYWDKRSWIASWYEGGKRYYKSFSAKTHGFYRSKYWAIKVRLSKVQNNHPLVSRSSKVRSSGGGNSGGSASSSSSRGGSHSSASGGNTTSSSAHTSTTPIPQHLHHHHQAALGGGFGGGGVGRSGGSGASSSDAYG